MLARVLFLVCFLSYCLIHQIPCALSADPSPPNSQEELGEDIGTIPLVSPAEFEKYEKCLKVNRAICGKDYARCQKEQQSASTHPGFSYCLQQKLSCLNTCKSDYKACRSDCTQNYTPGCSKGCRKTRRACEQNCEKDGNDCTLAAVGLKPVTQPKINCRQRWEDCKKIAEDLCKKAPTNPGKRK